MLKRFCSKMFQIKFQMLNLYEQRIAWFMFFSRFTWIFFTWFIIKSNWFLSLLSAGFWVIWVIAWFLRILFTCRLTCIFLSFSLLTLIIFLRCSFWCFGHFWFRFWCFWRFWFVIIWFWFFRFIFSFCFTLFSFRLVSFSFTLSFFWFSFFTLFFFAIILIFSFFFIFLFLQKFFKFF